MAEDVVRAKQFELVDDSGNVYARLGSIAGTSDPVLTFYDDALNPRIGIGMDEGSRGYVTLDGADGTGGAQILVQENGASAITIRDEQGKIRCSIGYAPQGSEGAPNGTLNLAFSDETGQRVQLGVTPNGSSVLTLFDRQGKESASLAVEPEGNPNVALFNGEAPFTGIALMGPNGNIPAQIAFTGPDGEMRARIMLDEDGTPMLAFYDSEGKIVWGGVGEKRADENGGE